MRSALISIAGQPRDREGAELRVAGKSVAERQLEFALATGCKRILALGDATSSDALTLRRVAEEAGADYRAVGNIHGLLGATSATDELLVVAPGLLADEHSVAKLLDGKSIILVVPAATAVPAGFERIDLERAWAGVAVIPGSLTERLADLPEDFDATSALLRIALQSRVPEGRIAEKAMSEGSWAMVNGDSQVRDIEQAWLERRLRARAGEGVSAWLAGEALGLSAGWLLERRNSFGLILMAAILLLVGGIAAAWWNQAAIGFALVALAAFAIEFVTAMVPLQETRKQARFRKLVLMSGALVDVAITGCAILAIDGEWLHRLYPPAVLMLALHLRVPAIWPDAVRVLGDRFVLAAFLVIATAFDGTESAIMAVSLGMLLLKVARLGGSQG